MDTIVCASCGTTNRVARFKIGAKATCGRCGAALPEPMWVHITRSVKKHAIPIGIISLIGIFYGYEKKRAPEVIQSNYNSGLLVPRSYVSPVLEHEVMPLRIKAPHEQCVPLPINNGIRERYTKGKALIPFRLETNPGGNYFIVLINDSTNRTVLTTYTLGGTPLEMKVPAGTYRINYAFGDKPWCGEVELFGEGTETSTADDKFVFRDTGTEYEGHVIRLVRQANGNLTTSPISPKNLFGSVEQLMPKD